jgi:hypothetical protein
VYLGRYLVDVTLLWQWNFAILWYLQITTWENVYFHVESIFPANKSLSWNNLEKKKTSQIPMEQWFLPVQRNSNEKITQVPRILKGIKTISPISYYRFQ